MTSPLPHSALPLPDTACPCTAVRLQVLSLRALGISGGSLTSLSSKDDVASMYGRLDRGELKLLYVTPEK